MAGLNFQRGRTREDPEINLIPMIDVLLVILIFLMVTTTYAKFAELQINLPEASAQKTTEQAGIIQVSVDAAGHYGVNNTPVVFHRADDLAQALKLAAGKIAEPVININADASATHQSVINVMEAARLAGYTRITFTTQAKEQQ